MSEETKEKKGISNHNGFECHVKFLVREIIHRLVLKRLYTIPIINDFFLMVYFIFFLILRSFTERRESTDDKIFKHVISMSLDLNMN